MYTHLTSSTTSGSCCKLSIELLPEFGWSARGEPVYGPGSVFQGFVKLKSDLPIQADQVRLAFHAYEGMQPIELSAGVLRAQKKRTLFGVQHKIWKGQCLKNSQTIPFIIQIPTVQYPPSVVGHPYYTCVFRLTAMVELGDKTILSTGKGVQYQPFIETSLLKHSISLTPYFSIRSLDYLPGETISLVPTYASASSTSEDSAGTLSTLIHCPSVTVKLIQRSYLQAMEDVPELVTVITTEKWKGTEEPVCLTIPSNQTPSLSYSSILAVTYALQVTIKHKRKLWTSSSQTDEYPIRIGTLGHGVRVPTDLEVYSTMTGEQAQAAQPKFIQAIEYKDSLPAYDHARLPKYQVYS